MQRFFDHIFAYYDSLLPIGSDEITKRLQMRLNNPQCGHVDVKKGKNSQFFGEITIKAIPPIYSALSWVGSIPSQSDCHDMRSNIT